MHERWRPVSSGCSTRARRPLPRLPSRCAPRPLRCARSTRRRRETERDARGPPPNDCATPMTRSAPASSPTEWSRSPTTPPAPLQRARRNAGSRRGSETDLPVCTLESQPMSAHAAENDRSFFREFTRNRRLLGVALIAALGGFLFGYDTGIIGGAMLFMQKDLGLKTHGQQQLAVAILLLGAIVGALIAGWLADKISRRRTKMISGSVYVIGGIGCALAQSYWQILAGRFWLGLAVGCASFVSPMYIAELVPPGIRGAVVSFNQLMVTLGILVAYISDWAFAGVSNNWRWMFAVAAIPGAALAIGMFFMPYSPRWLVEQGRENEAKDVLSRLRGPEDEIDGEIAEIKDGTKNEASLGDLMKKSVRPMLTVGVALAIFQQIVGINTVIYYAPTILKF